MYIQMTDGLPPPPEQSSFDHRVGQIIHAFSKSLFQFNLFCFIYGRLIFDLSLFSIFKIDELDKQKEIDDWLPITSSRNAKWWYSTFHNVTAMVGAGVLGLPYSMAQLGWYVIVIVS